MPVTKDIDNEKENEVSTEDRNPNEVRDLIYMSLSIAEYSKIPFLFMGNPGIAKTTGVRLWAEHYGYKVTTLIGTQRVAEEILGYMVNDTGEKRLITYTPDWFDEIMDNKKKGSKTLLFVDELSQAPDNVQGAMLQLIFDRKVGGRANYLPDDCVVVSAANYKGNIPPQCGIQAPTLNRFCIVNVKPVDGVGLVEEFLQSDEERLADIPVYTKIDITENIKESVRKNLKNSMSSLFKNYSTSDAKETTLNIQNTNFNDIFDQPGDIHNFISGRTIHYLRGLAQSCIHLGIIRKKYKRQITNMVYGLIGLGTNSFSSERAKEDYLLLVQRTFQMVLRKSVEDNVNEINAKEIDYKGKTVEKCISDWMRYNESSGRVNDININRLIEIIEKRYDPSVEGMRKVIENWDGKKALVDLQKIDSLTGYLKKADLLEIKPIVKKLEIINASYEAYRAALLNNLAH